MRFVPIIGRGGIYQLPPEREGTEGEQAVPSRLRGRDLFTRDLTYWDLERRFREGSTVKRTRITAEFGFDDFVARYGTEEAPAVPLFVVDAEGRLRIATGERVLRPEPGDTLIALVSEAHVPAA
jgi:hypothetical protein